MPTAGFNGEMGPEARILLVDDDVGSTGMTMKSVFNYLQAKGFKNIKTAVIRGNSQKFPVNYSVTPETPVLLFPWPWRN